MTDEIFPYQTRSYTKGIKDHKTLQIAYHEWENDSDLWKISWGFGEVNRYRFRPKKKDNLWDSYSEKRMCSLSDKYKNGSSSQLFWINQLLCPPGYFELSSKYYDNKISKKEYNEKIDDISIVEVLTDDEFKNKYIK